MADDLSPLYGALAPNPGTEYGNILPIARDPIGPAGAYLQSQGYNVQQPPARLAMPGMLRSGAKGYLDLLNSTQTGSLTPEALSAITFGSLGAGGALAPRGSLAAGGSFKAYHGSPHNFDRFDLSKIGTGEGAQAYGHGLYFADREAIAKSYRDQLSSPMFKTPDGTLFDPQSQLQHLNVRVAAHRNGPDLDATIARARELLPKAGEQTRPMIEHDIAILQQFKDAGGISTNRGHMYEVNIHADPARFLDWDKPLGGQSAPVRTLDDMYWRQHANRQPDITQFLRSAEGANAAQELGIPGIRYLDRGSRSAGEGSRNTVVFNPDIVEILRKYGIMAPSPVAPAVPYSLAPNAAQREAMNPGVY